MELRKLYSISNNTYTETKSAHISYLFLILNLWDILNLKHTCSGFWFRISKTGQTRERNSLTQAISAELQRLNGSMILEREPISETLQIAKLARCEMRAAKCRHDAIQTLQKELLRPTGTNPQAARELTDAISNLTLNPSEDQHPRCKPPDPDPDQIAKSELPEAQGVADQEPLLSFPTDEQKTDEAENRQADTLENLNGMALKKQKISQPSKPSEESVSSVCSVKPSLPKPTITSKSKSWRQIADKGSSQKKMDTPHGTSQPGDLN